MNGTSGGPFLGVEHSVGGQAWRARPGDERLGLALAQRLALPEIIGRILAARGVALESAHDFLNPTLRTTLPDPSRLCDMNRAAERLADAIEAQESVAVFGDYDVDGASGSALLHRVLSALGAPPRLYVPDRISEGYGPNRRAFERLRAEGVRLILTVDCGASAYETLAWAEQAGLDVIVLDHHVCEAALPRAYAVVNPNRLDDTSGCGSLAAVGVAFLFAVALNRGLRARGAFGTRPEPDLLSELDLVALGTVCDQVALTGINRALVTQGLKVMAERRNLGLRALADVAGIEARPSAYHAGFVLGPRINAGGRVGRSDLGVRLLTSRSADEALTLAHELDALNAERQAIEAAVYEAALARIEAEAGRPDKAVLIVAGEGWHPGVIGIVAGRLVERYRRPVAVIALAEGVGKASARSVSGADFGAAVTAARQAGLLINGGGHPMAAGFTVAGERIGLLDEFLNARLGAGLRARAADSALRLDGALEVAAANLDLARQLEPLAPFGVGNAEPRFAVLRARLEFAKAVGGSHVRCAFKGAAGSYLQGIAFRSLATPVGQALLQRRGQAFHVAGRLRRDEYRGRERAQFFVDDLAEL